MKNSLFLIFFLMFANPFFAQTYIKGTVTSIENSIAFRMINDVNKDTLEIVLNDTELFDDDNKNKLAKDYLEKKILNKKIIVSVMSTSKSKIYCSVLYNCKHIQTLEKQEDIPCSEGNILDIEMIGLGLIKYIGKNDYLKSLINNN